MNNWRNQPGSRERSVDVSKKVQSVADAAKENLAAELDRLRQRRHLLELECKNDRGMIGDHGDAAEAIQRADELVVLADRINELDRRLRTGSAPEDDSDALPGGTEVTLKFSDGEVATMYVISVVEETPVGREAETLTARSPLAQALVGHKADETGAHPQPQRQSHDALRNV